VEIQNQKPSGRLVIKREGKYFVDVAVSMNVEIGYLRYREVEAVFKVFVKFDDVREFINKVISDGIEKIYDEDVKETIKPKIPDDVIISDDMITITDEELIYLTLRYLVLRKSLPHIDAVDRIINEEWRYGINAEWIKEALKLMLFALKGDEYEHVAELVDRVVSGAMYAIHKAKRACKDQAAKIQEKKEGVSAVENVGGKEEKNYLNPNDSSAAEIRSESRNNSRVGNSDNEVGAESATKVEETGSEDLGEPVLVVSKLFEKIYVNYKGRVFYLRNVEWEEIGEALKDIVKSYDSGYRFISLWTELVESRKIVVGGDEIKIYELPYKSIIKDFVVYLIGRAGEGNEGAYFMARNLDDEAKDFIIWLVERQRYEINEEQLKRIYRVMETTFRILNPNYSKPRRRKEEY